MVTKNKRIHNELHNLTHQLDLDYGVIRERVKGDPFSTDSKDIVLSPMSGYDVNRFESLRLHKPLNTPAYIFPERTPPGLYYRVVVWILYLRLPGPPRLSST